MESLTAHRRRPAGAVLALAGAHRRRARDRARARLRRRPQPRRVHGRRGRRARSTPTTACAWSASAARLMAEIQSERPGAMAAIIGLDAERARGALRARPRTRGWSRPRTSTRPTQIVVSGEDGRRRAAAASSPTRRARGGRSGCRSGAAFHSELMKPVQSPLAETMEALDWSDPEVPLVANFSGEPVADAAAVRQALIDADRQPGALGRLRADAARRGLHDLPRARPGPRAGRPGAADRPRTTCRRPPPTRAPRSSSSPRATRAGPSCRTRAPGRPSATARSRGRRA